MAVRYDDATGMFIVINDATGEEVGRFEEVKQAATANLQANPPAEGATGEGGSIPIDMGTTTWRKKPENAADVAALDRWNRLHAKDFGNISDSQAELQANVYRFMGIGFEDSLNLYARYVNGETGIPAPTPEAVRDWYGQFKTDTERAAAADWARGPVAAARGLPAGAEQTDVGKAILAVTNDPAIQAAMWHGATQEGGVEGPWGTAPGEPHVGGAGEVGPWQISPVHWGDNIDAQSAADPYAAARWMLPDYQNGVASVPPELWQTDPGGATVLAVANAERPEGWHEGLTVEEAIAIYGERAETGPIVTGGPRGLPGGLPAVPGAPELTSTERMWNEALPQPLSQGDLLQYKQEHPELSGKALIDNLYAAYHAVNPGAYPLSTDEATIAKLRAAHPKAEAWTDDDWRYFIANEMTLEDMRAAEAAGQTPQAYVAKSLQEFSAFLKTNKLTLQEFQQASKIISDAEMQDAIAWGTGNPGYMKEYIEARRQGLGHGDIQRGYVAGESPLQTTVRIQTELAKEAETARLTAAREEALKGPEYQTGVGAEIAAEVRRAPTGTPIDVAVSNALGPRIEAEIGDIKAARERRWQEYQQDRYWHGAGPGGMPQFFSGAGGFWGLGGPPGLPPAMSWELGRRLNAIFAAATPEQRLEAYRKAGYSEAEAAAQPGAAGATSTGVPQPATAAARGATPTAAPATAGAQATILQGAGGTKYNPATGQWQVVTRPVTPEKVNAVTPEPVATGSWKYNPATGRWEVPTRAVTPEKVNRVTPEPATVATPEPIDWTKWKPWAQTAAAAATPQPATAEARAYGGLAMMRRGTSKKAPAAAGFRKRKASGLTAL